LSFRFGLCLERGTIYAKLPRDFRTLKSLGTDVITLVALLVCLIPTTIGALLAAIGIAGMDRRCRQILFQKAEKAVELARDIDVVLLD